MKLRLCRREFTPRSTIGVLYVDGLFECYTLEDADRKLESGGSKIPGETAIPRGTYNVIITHSNRFKRELPLLCEVPGYEGVRIHPGNGPNDTEGCILVGSGIPADKNDWLLNSRAAFDVLFRKIDAALELGETVEVSVE